MHTFPYRGRRSWTATQHARDRGDHEHVFSRVIVYENFGADTLVIGSITKAPVLGRWSSGAADERLRATQAWGGVGWP